MDLIEVFANIDIIAFIVFLGVVCGALISIIKVWDKSLNWFGDVTIKKVNIKDLPDSTSLKCEFNNLHQSLDNITTQNEDIREDISELRKQHNETDTSVLRLEILRGIDHDIGKEYVLERYNVYKAKGENGYIDYVVKEYINKDSKKGIDFFKANKIGER